MVAMAFELPPLPYPKNALEPHISERTMDFHHGRHHQAYVTNLNNLVKGSPMESQSLEDIIKATYKDTSKTGVFNNAAQVWNHTFFWNCMKPNGGGLPTRSGNAPLRRGFSQVHAFVEQPGGVLPIRHPQRLGTRQPGQHDLGGRHFPGARMGLLPAEPPPIGSGIERRPAIVAD